MVFAEKLWLRSSRSSEFERITIGTPEDVYDDNRRAYSIHSAGFAEYQLAPLFPAPRVSLLSEAGHGVGQQSILGVCLKNYLPNG